ncbi:MAG: hypothetical protein IT306_18875 [Chloroflexi bacterium]|nr:hypothetical protein [Chloroflexota bacterium]
MTTDSRLLDWTLFFGANMRQRVQAAARGWAGLQIRGLVARIGRPHLRSHRSGQALVETAITTLLSVVTVVVVLQLSMVVAQAISAAHVARQTSRWLAVRIDTIDSAVSTQATAFAANLPGVSNGGITSVTVSPSCASLTGGKCASRSSGDAVTVSVTANLSHVMFLPTTIGVAPLQFRLPSTMPAIAYTVLLE